MNSTRPPSLWRRMRGGFWYAWGLSLCYSGNRSAEQSFYRSGVSSFTRAVELWPALAAAYYRRGLIRGRELGEYTAAIADLDRASALRPEWPEPYLQRGLFHRFNQRPEQAIIDLARFVELSQPGYWRDEASRQIALLRGETAE